MLSLPAMVLLGSLFAAPNRAGSEPPKILLAAPDVLAGPVREGVTRERPETRFVDAGAAPELVFRIREENAIYRLTAERHQRRLETRDIGTSREVDPAIRLAVLLIVQNIDALSAEREIEPAPSAPVALVPSSPPAAAWRISAALSAFGWASPTSLQIGGSVAGLRRFDGLMFGARLIASGACCAIRREGVLQADAQLIALVLEGRAELWSGPIGVWVVLSAGLGFEHAAATALAFRGTAGAEETRLGSGLLRAAGLIEVPLWDDWALELQVGIQAHTAGLSVVLPAPYDQSALQRGLGFPFFELGMALDLF